MDETEILSMDVEANAARAYHQVSPQARAR